jgi:hypothetical protein
MQQNIFFALKPQLTAIRFFYSLFWILLGAIIYFNQESFNYWSTYAYFFMMVGLIYLIILLKSYFELKPGLYLDEKELIIKHPLSKFKISWSEISSFEIIDLKRRSLLIIRLIDNEKSLAQQNSFARRIGALLEKQYGSPGIILIDYFQAPRRKILAELNFNLEKSQNLKKKKNDTTILPDLAVVDEIKNVKV